MRITIECEGHRLLTLFIWTLVLHHVNLFLLMIDITDRVIYAHTLYINLNV